MPWKLALRLGEWYGLDFEPRVTWPNIYAVCLLDVPAVPEGALYEQCRPYAVIAMQYTAIEQGEDPKWGWVHLEYSTKQVLGQSLYELLDRGAIKTGQWVYLTVFPNKP